MSRTLLNVRAAAALALIVLMVGVAAHGDVVIFKDGFAIHGNKIGKEKDVWIDPDSGMAFVMTKANGLTAIDDGPRWTVFPSSALQLADVRDTNRFKDFTPYTRTFTKGEEKLPSTARNPVDVQGWDYKAWTKVVKYEDADPRVKHTVKLHISVMTPHYIRVGSSSHQVGRYFLLKEWDPAIVRKFITNHPDLVEMPGKPDADRREKLIRFWIQADLLEEADKDLEQLLVALPAEKDRHARLKSEVNGLRAEKIIAEIERAHDSGRNQWAMDNLASFAKTFPKGDVPNPVAMRVTALLVDYDKRTQQFNECRRMLDVLAKQVNAANKFLIDGAVAVRNEVHLDTLSRLEMFMTLADRAEKDIKQDRRPSQSPEELLAAAITGWHLGKVAAETKVGQAYKVWMSRQMALDYFRTPAAGNRQAVIKRYLAGEFALKYDDLEKLVSLIPPPEQPEVLPVDTVKVNLPPTVASPLGVNFLLRLPDEYQPGRSYPLLLLFPDPLQDRGAQGLLDRFGDLPSRNGYIVAAVQWWDVNKLAVSYGYSKDEHAMVMQLLSHLRRTYQVDSDRVFLLGNGEGGAMALDIGGSHPDQFAGIVPMNPSVHQPLYIPYEYWVNFHQLPVYMVMGDKFGNSVKAIRMMSERWMPKGFPTLVVSYKGRSMEWFAGELPYAFDWMNRKRRAEPGKVLGPPGTDRTKPGFSTVRLSDNRFHWLSADLKPERTMGNVKTSTQTAPVKLSASIVDGNTVKASAIGARELTIWFRNGMLDYTKPVKIQIADVKPATETITPEIEVLMEDLYERADRQRPYFAKREYKVP
ncbi:MAG TPA: hypothetical protein VHR66_05365 [Gemmataceae bacterium]|jgi:pimeloyl-ACP methyl ester carboxylesterase|nr:hypothetical protein [Gemmataceae bacterium]